MIRFTFTVAPAFLLSISALLLSCGANTTSSGVASDAAGANAVAKAAAGTCAVVGADAITSMRFELPPAGTEGNATVRFYEAGAERGAWKIAEALDLYDRSGRLAQVSGGVFNADYSPVVTMRAFFNVQDGAKSGFVELDGKRAELRDCAW